MNKSFAALLTILIAATNALSQSFTLDSFTKAKAVLDRSATAYGGREALNAIANVSIRLGGESVHRNQSRKPGDLDRTEYTGQVIIDLKNSRALQTQKGHYPGGFDWYNGFVVDNNVRTGFDFIRKTSSPPGNITPAIFRGNLRWLPQLVVLTALERADTLRYLGKTEYEKRPHEVIDYVSHDNLRLALYIDETTGQLSKYETVITNSYSGDSLLETRFPGQRKVGNYLIPTARVSVLNGDVLNDFRYADVAFNTELPPETFKVPEGFRAITFPTPPPVTKHAENVYTTNAGGYNVLFVDFKDYIFVMETPGNERTSLQAIEQIRKTIPNKPIKYVAVTHHHDDHAGGIRTYMAEGATLIVAPGEQAFFRKVSEARFKADPDALTRNPREPIFEPLQNGKRVLTDGTTTVELYDIGAGPHTQEMLVAYFPQHKLIYQGDLLNRPANGDPPIVNDTSVHFFKWLDSKKLAVDATIPVHGPFTTMDEFRKAIAEKKDRAN
ncbi:MAG TPA: MBL fold metallo-hydrolase [Pyrinomonadaceae bacterium]|jgi:glyoxylase-like metal-dependent hydrolase (beta-lactamase superfamily II)|nr:MBL fold metallo-hydrolase [Pyrinomonadaceae bacterium]